MVAFRGSRHSRYKKRGDQREDRLVKITLMQSAVTVIGVSGLLVFNLLGGISDGKKQGMLDALVKNHSPQEMALGVGSVIDNFEDSYIARVVQQVINLYQEPIEVAVPPINQVPITKPPMDSILEPSANLQDDYAAIASQGDEPVEPKNEAADAPKEEVKTGTEQKNSGEQPPLPIKAAGLKFVDSQNKGGASQLSQLDISVPGDVVVGGIITSGFGFRKHPITGKQDYHTGVDIGAKAGSEIHVPYGGKVVTTGVDYAYGNYLIIDHDDGVMTYYSHCQTILVKVGQLVKANQVVAKVGNTGLSTGPHLHFEIMIDGSYVDPQNPQQGWEVV